MITQHPVRPIRPVALFLLWVAGFGFVFPALGAEIAGTGNVVTVRVFSLPQKKDTGASNVAAYNVVHRFLELHPLIRLESSTTLQIEGESMDAAPLMSIAGGTSPDIIYVNFRQSDTYIGQGFLYPLDEYVAQLSPRELADRVPPSILSVIDRAGPDGKKHYWAMPQEIGATILLYRKDLFAQAGLDPDQPPRDWKELEEDARKLTDPGQGRYGLAFTLGPEASYGIFSYLSSAGAQAVIQAPDGQWKAAFDSPAAVTGYEFVIKLMKEQVTREGESGPISYVGADAWTKINEGKVAIFFGNMGERQMAEFDPDSIAAAPFPKGPTGLSVSQVNARMLGIFAGVKDRRVRDAAWEYIKFMNGREAHRVYTETMVEQGASQLVNPLWLEEFGYPELARFSLPGLVELYRNAVKNGIPEPYGRNCQFVYSYMTSPLEKLYYTDFTNMTDAERDAVFKSVLEQAVKETNERMLGRLSPETRQMRNTVAWGFALVMGMAFAGVIRLLFKWISKVPVSSSADGNRRRSILAAIFILPAFLLILLWNYYPLARGSLMAFQDYNVMGGSPWVGINNFADVIFDPRFWSSLKNAFYFCALWMLMGFLPPVMLAVILQEISLGKIMFRILFYIPAVVSGVVILFMWRALYDPSPDGILNRIIACLGIPTQTWLQDPKLAMLCVVFPLAWASLGPGSIIYLAALKGIPDELYEASDIDGASFTDKLRYIVLPYMKPLLVINAVGATIFGFKSGDAVLAMTGGGPDGATQVIGYEIWQRTFLFLKFGQGTAMAWILGLILLAFTAYQMRILARVEFRTAAK